MLSLKKSISEVWDHNLLEVGDENSVVIYCDMDGVLVDFNAGFKQISGGQTAPEYEKIHGKQTIWPLIHAQSNGGIDWWAGLPKMEHADELWKFLTLLRLPLKILSSTSSRASKSNAGDIGKRKWLLTNLSPAPSDKNIILIDSAEAKKNYAKGPDHILIDDYQKNINQWRASGGTGVHYIDVSDTIDQLKKILGIQSESHGYSWSNR